MHSNFSKLVEIFVSVDEFLLEFSLIFQKSFVGKKSQASPIDKLQKDTPSTSPQKTKKQVRNTNYNNVNAQKY